MAVVEEGALVALADEDGARVLLRAEGGAQKVPGVGILAPGKLVGVAYGARYEHGSTSYRVLRPGIRDLTLGLARKAAIIQPKDASRIVFECDVRAGASVVEAGVGSAALTTALAWAVAPGGRVHTYEMREDFAKWGRANLERNGLIDHVDLKVRDVTQGVDEREVDAFILDMPDPWNAVPAAKEALRGDGHFCAYTPQVSQLERTVRALRDHAFFDIRSIELIERPWVVAEHGSRPDHQMLGHTAFLTFARNAR